MPDLVPPPGHLAPGEPHPAAFAARRWLADHLGPDGHGDAAMLVEAFASSAMAGDRAASICGETLRRLLAGEPVSDRYVLALCWTVASMDGMIRNPTGQKDSITS
jgi:hypothetical protein